MGHTGVICAKILRKKGEETPRDKSVCSSSQESGVKAMNETLNNHLKGIPCRFCHKCFADCPVVLLTSPEEELRLILTAFFKQLLMSCIFQGFLLMATV